MAPRASSQQRRTLGPQSEHVYELGVAGRKTGIVLKDTGIRDEHGMEPLDALFSSPRKEASEEENVSGDDGSGEDMDITTTSGIGPAALLNGHHSRLPNPLPRARSPIKTSLNSPAQRNRLLARSSSPTHGSGIRDRASHSSSQPNRDQSTAKRRLDFSALQAGAKALSQPTTNGGGRHHAIPGARGPQHSRRQYDEEEEEEEEEEPEHVDEQDEQDIEEFVDQSVAMLSGGDDDDMVDLPNYESPEEEVEPVQVTAAAKKKPGRKPKAKDSPPAAKPGRKPPRRVAEPESEHEQEEEPQDDAPSEDEEPEEVVAKPQQTGTGKRGRPAKGKAVPSKESPAQPPSEPRSKKRRSPIEDNPVEEESSSGRKSKKPRTNPNPEPEPTPPSAFLAATKGRGRPAAKKTDAAPAKAQAPAPEKAKKGRRRKSSIDPNDTSQVMIPRGPPLPKSRGLVINRRETPDSFNSSMHRTRSGRTSFKPLAFWKNEHAEFDREKASDNFAAPGQPTNFVLDSIKEIVRIDDPEPDFSSHRRKGNKKAGKKAKSGYYDTDDGLADAWEQNPGAIEGEVAVWYPEHDKNPPGVDDEIEMVDRQLAISAKAIRTSKVKNASFKFAKTASEGFFGAGVVDMPPGSVKNQKNSRKMFMTFFVFSGKVLVSINESTFRISKGGMWFVPRGNYYSIENDYDQPARIFFSQGCEVTVRSGSADPEPSVMMEGDGGESQNESQYESHNES